jgi:hypothetical protein
MCKTRQARPAKFFALLEAAPAFAGPADDAEQGLSTYPSAGECHFVLQRMITQSGRIVLQRQQVCE